MPSDILLESNGDLAFSNRHVSDADPTYGPQLIAQWIRTRLLTMYGTYLLDRTVGVPNLQWSHRKTPPVPFMTHVYRREVESVGKSPARRKSPHYVARTEPVAASFNRQTRAVSIEINAYTASGTTLRVDVFPLGVLGESAPDVQIR